MHILTDGAYVHIELKDRTSKAVRMLVYGTLEKYFEIECILSQVCKTKPKNNLRGLLYVSAYAVKNSFQPYNVTLNAVFDALEGSGKGAVKEFFAAVLGKINRAEYVLPAKGKKGYEEIAFNMPSWLIGMYKKDYPDDYESVILNSAHKKTHVVVYDKTVGCPEGAFKTDYGFYIGETEKIKTEFDDGKVTFMSLGSVYICEAVGDVVGEKVLDCCAAPGGKSVFLAKKGACVTACDIHKHRLDLIDAYARRTKTSIECLLQDATEEKSDFIEKYDVVLCDAPCSGFGVIDKKRDIVFSRKFDDIVALAALQGKILQNVAKYIKKGGLLVYSTCTVFDRENGAVIREFLEKNRDFSLEKMPIPFENDGWKQFLPDGKGMEGFFVCRMRKK